jgi:hypothetical protein
MIPPHKSRNNILVIVVRNKEANYKRDTEGIGIGFLKWKLGSRKKRSTR